MYNAVYLTLWAARPRSFLAAENGFPILQAKLAASWPKGSVVCSDVSAGCV